MKVGIIGCGSMGASLAAAIHTTCDLLLYNRDQSKSEALAKKLDAKAVDTIDQIADKADILIIAVLPTAVESVASHFSQLEDKWVISIAGGVSLDYLKSLFPAHQCVAALPNVAVSAQEGVIGFVDDPELKSRKKIEDLFEKAGLLIWLEEEKLHALSALAGSGPGFVALIIESFVEAGIAMGLTSEEALMLTTQTLKGTSRLIEKEGIHPAELKWSVAAPGGSTIAGLVAMENLGLRSAILEGILATREKIDS